MTASCTQHCVRCSGRAHFTSISNTIEMPPEETVPVSAFIRILGSVNLPRDFCASQVRSFARERISSPARRRPGAQPTTPKEPPGPTDLPKASCHSTDAETPHAKAGSPHVPHAIFSRSVLCAERESHPCCRFFSMTVVRLKDIGSVMGFGDEADSAAKR